MFKVLKYNQLNEGVSKFNYLPTYEDCIEMCSKEESVFYETKHIVDGYTISIFNYRLAQFSDFITPLPNRNDVKAYEMRGLSFVFNKDGSLYKRFLLLEKFFNLNQTPDSMYSVVKDYKIKFVNNKEDGSIASFIQLPNGKIFGKSKMSFDNEQSYGINKLFKENNDVNGFVKWCMNNDITPIFEYVSPQNRIVLRYSKEELILLRLRDNNTGKHIDIKEHLDKIGSIKIAPFKDDFVDLDSLIELTGTEIDKEGYVIQAEDENGNDKFFKIKTPWYSDRHGLLTNDIYRENTIIGHILDDKIDDILGQIPEEEVEAHNRINKIIGIVRKLINEKVKQIDELYKIYESFDSDKEFAMNYLKDPNFSYVMIKAKARKLKKLSQEDIIELYKNNENYEKALKRCDSFELAKSWISDNTKRLELARSWIKKKDPSFQFRDKVEDTEE